MNKQKAFSLVEIVAVISIISILLLIAVPNMLAYLERTNVYKQEQISSIITATLKQEFIDYNGLTINLSSSTYNDENHYLQQSIRTKLNLADDSIIQFYGYGYTHSNDSFKSAITTQVNTLDQSAPIYLVALPNHNTNGQANANNGTATIGASNVILNLNYPIRMAIKLPNQSEILFYENGKQI